MSKVPRRAEVVMWQKHPERRHKMDECKSGEEVLADYDKERMQFGVGFMLSLVKFARHWEQWSHRRDDTSYRDEWFTFTMMAGCDHLYECHLPSPLQKGRIPELFKRFMDIAFEARDFGVRQSSATQSELHALVEEALDALCLEVDRLLFEETQIKPVLGDMP